MQNISRATLLKDTTETEFIEIKDNRRRDTFKNTAYIKNLNEIQGKIFILKSRTSKYIDNKIKEF